MESKNMRIDKLLSHLKYGSRKEMKSWLIKHIVLVDGERVKIADTHVDPNTQAITIDGVKLFYQENIHLAIYKPKGYVSANQDALHPCVVDLVQEPFNRFDFKIAGRLDLDAEGLLILTTDGQFVHDITHPKSHVPKKYEVTLDQPFTHKKALLKGVDIKDGYNEIYHAKALDIHVQDHSVIITIDEGKFHQVKRMFMHVGYEVLSLKRTHIGNLALSDLEPGTYREFRKEACL